MIIILIIEYMIDVFLSLFYIFNRNLSAADPAVPNKGESSIV